MTQVGFLAIADRPGPVAVSDDGSTLWIGLRDTPEIVPVDVATLSEGARVALGVGVNLAFDRLATFLRVAPGTTDTVVVASEGTREVVAFSGGAQLPNIVDELGAATMFEFRGAASIVGIHDDDNIVLRGDFHNRQNARHERLPKSEVVLMRNKTDV